MPGQLRRFQSSGDHHFVTFSCRARLPYFTHADACEAFERALELVRRRYVLFVFGYVIMPEHVHLLLSEPKVAALGNALQALKASVAKRRIERPFWIPRYYDFNVFSIAKQREKLRYIHRNPVTRGLVYEPQDWRWSSFRHYLSGEPGTVEIESPWTAGRREGLQLLGRGSDSKSNPP